MLDGRLHLEGLALPQVVKLDQGSLGLLQLFLKLLMLLLVFVAMLLLELLDESLLAVFNSFVTSIEVMRLIVRSLVVEAGLQPKYLQLEGGRLLLHYSHFPSLVSARRPLLQGLEKALGRARQ